MGAIEWNGESWQQLPTTRWEHPDPKIAQKQDQDPKSAFRYVRHFHKAHILKARDPGDRFPPIFFIFYTKFKADSAELIFHFQNVIS